MRTINPSQKSPDFSPKDECKLFFALEGASAFRPRGSTIALIVMIIGAFLRSGPAYSSQDFSSLRAPSIFNKQTIEFIGSQNHAEAKREVFLKRLASRLQEIAPSLKEKQLKPLGMIVDWVVVVYLTNGLTGENGIYHNLSHAFEVSEMAMEFVHANRNKEGYDDNDILSAVMAGLLRDVARPKPSLHPNVQYTVTYLNDQADVKRYIEEAGISWLTIKSLILGTGFPYDDEAKTAFHKSLNMAKVLSGYSREKLENLASILRVANNSAPYLMREPQDVRQAVIGLPREIKTRMSEVLMKTGDFLENLAGQDNFWDRFDRLPSRFKENWERTNRLVKAWNREYTPLPEDAEASVYTIIKTLSQYLHLDNTQIHSLYSLFGLIVEQERQDGLEEYEGYHGLRHTLEVCYLAMQMAISKKEEKGYAAENILTVTVSGLLHDYDNRLRLKGEKDYSAPMVMRTIRTIDGDPRIKDLLKKLGIDLHVVNALIWRTDFPYTSASEKGPAQEFDKETGLAKMYGFRKEQIEEMANLLSYADKSAVYVLRDPAGVKEAVEGLGLEVPQLAGTSGFMGTKASLDRQLANKKEFMEYMAWLPGALQEKWERTNEVVSRWKDEGKAMPGNEEDAVKAIVELSRELMLRLEDRKFEAFKELLSWTIERYHKDGLMWDAPCYHSVRQMLEVVYMVLEGSGPKLITVEMSQDDLLILSVAAILQNLEAGDRKRGDTFTHPQVDRTLAFIDPEKNPDIAGWLKILDIDWLTLKAIIRRTDYPFERDYVDVKRRQMGEEAVSKYMESAAEAVQALGERVDKKAFRQKIDDLGAILASVNLSAVYLNRTDEEITQALLALEKTTQWGDIIKGTYRFLVKTTGGSKHFKDYLAGLPYSFQKRWDEVIDLAKTWREQGAKADVTEAMPETESSSEERVILAVINHAFKDLWDHNPQMFRKKFYDKNFYRKNKLLLIGKLQAEFEHSYLQRFYSNFIEVSIYDAKSRSRTIYRFVREQDGHAYVWRPGAEREDQPAVEIIKDIDMYPLKTMLVNLESRHYQGVKGSPEGIKAIQAYLEEFNPRESHLTVFDNQWPENDSDFLLEQIILDQPDVVGISAPFGSLEELEKVIRALISLDKPPLIVVGNLLATWSYEYLLEKYPQILIVRLEGEEAQSEILKIVYKADRSIKRIPASYDFSRVSNLVFAKTENGTNIIIRTKPGKVDLAKLPPPVRDEEELDRMREAGWLANSEGRGRGCGYSRCYICTRTHGAWRDIPIDRALSDFETYLVSRTKAITYVDEDFGETEPERLGELQALADDILKLKDHYAIEYYARHRRYPPDATFYAAMRVRSIYKAGDNTGNKMRIHVLRKLKEAGLIKIFLGEESGSPVHLSKTYNKDSTVEENIKAIEICRQLGIQVVTGFIPFAPDSTLAQVKEEISFMRENKLVSGDPLTEAVNPFKMYRAQIAAPLTQKLNNLGFISSDHDPNNLMFDEVYRNPVVKMITDLGKEWRFSIDEFEYYLKNIVWSSQYSKEAMEKAGLFLDLFGDLRSSSYALIEEFLGEAGRFSFDHDKNIERFLKRIKEMPLDKALWELRRAMFPHNDIYIQVEKYIEKRKSDALFDMSVFLWDFLRGEFPDDFDFGQASKIEYSRWLEDIREDIAYQMLEARDIREINAEFEKIFRRFLEKRQALLKDFESSVWRIYFTSSPESTAIRKELEIALDKVMQQHKKLLQSNHYIDMDEARDFKIYWRVLLGDFIKYRHPSPAVPLGKLYEIISRMQEKGKYCDPEKAWIYNDGSIALYSEKMEINKVIQACGNIVKKIFLSSFNPFNPSQEKAEQDIIKLYEGVESGRFSNPADFMAELARIQRGILPERELVIDKTKIVFKPQAVDAQCHVSISRGDSANGKARLVLKGKGLPGSFEWHVPLDLITIEKGAVTGVSDKFGSYFRNLLKAILDERLSWVGKEYEPSFRYALINALIESLVKFPVSMREELLLIAEEVVDSSVLPQTVYLADTREMHELAAVNRDIHFIFITPVLFERLWPGIEPRLSEIIQFARPGIIDSFSDMLKAVKEDRLSPSFVRLIYETFYNRVNIKAFDRNENPEKAIAFTTSSLRYMPRKTPVFIVDSNDPRIEVFDSPEKDVWQSVIEEGKVKFIVNPYVWQEWKEKGVAIPAGVRLEWVLTYPTASHRSLFVMGENPDKDLIAKTHSTIIVGPAQRRLSPSSLGHSWRVSSALIEMFKDKRLPVEVRNFFSIFSEGGIAFEDNALYPGGIGVIYRSQTPYPKVKEELILVPLFALHNNDIRITENPRKPLLIQIIEKGIQETREDPVDFFIRSYLKPLYQIYLHLVFNEGLLNDPHGQNSFWGVNLEGMIKRLVGQDWQSTMVDLSQRKNIESALEFSKHILGEEAGRPLSLSLVFDHYVGHYLLEQLLKVLVDEYHGKAPKSIYRLELIHRFRKVFEETAQSYDRDILDFTDEYVRHGEKPDSDTSNRVWFIPDGPSLWRPTAFEKQIKEAISRGQERGIINIHWDNVRDDKAMLLEDPYRLSDMQLDLDRTRAYVDTSEGWQDARDCKALSGHSGTYKVILPKGFNDKEHYPVLLAFHHRGGSLSFLSNWQETIDPEKAIIVVPNAPFEYKAGYTWFEERDKNEMMFQKAQSEEYIMDILGNVQSNFKIGNIYAIGISQGGYLALQMAMRQKGLFKALFLVNTPFKENYFEELADLKKISGADFPEVFLLHFAGDSIVSPAHSRRAAGFFKEKGVTVMRKLYPYGAHIALSQAMGMDIKEWLKDEESGIKIDTDAPEASVESMIDLKDENITVMDQFYTLKARERVSSVRLPELPKLQQLIDSLGTAQKEMDSAIRNLSFLISLLAHQDNALSREDQLLFENIISAMPRTMYLLRRVFCQKVKALDQDSAWRLLETTDWISENIRMLERKIFTPDLPALELLSKSELRQGV